MADTLKDLIAETTAYRLPTHDKATTNWTPNTSTLLEATNKQIEENIESDKQQSLQMQEDLKYFYDQKEKTDKAKLKSFVSGGVALAKWIQDERKADKIFKEHQKLDKEIRNHKELNRILDISKDIFSLDKLDKAGFNWDVTDLKSPLFTSTDINEILERENYVERSLLKSELNADLMAWDANNLEGIDPFELYLLTSDTDSGQEIENKEAFYQKVDDFKPMGVQISGAHVFKAGSITNDRGEPLPRDMSYFEALESNNISDNAWAPYLEKALWSAYYAYWNKNYNLDGLSDREVKNRIFKPFLEEVSKNRGTIVNSLLEKRVGKAKQQRYIGLLNTLQSTDPLIGGMAGVTSKGGYISQNELLADGTKDNNQGWNNFADDIEFMAKQEIIWDGNRLEKILNQPFIRRDNGKKTTLAELKPEIYQRLSKVVNDLKAKETQTNDLAQTQTIDNAYVEIAPLANDAFDSGNASDIAMANQKIVEAMNKASRETGLPVTHPKFNDFKLLSDKLRYVDAHNAVTELSELQAKTGYLNWALIDRIPENWDGGYGRTNEKNYWIKQAQKYGAIGLGPEELGIYERRIETLVMNLGKYRHLVSKNFAGSKSAFIKDTNEYKNTLARFYLELNKVNVRNERELRLEPDNKKKDLLEQRFAAEAFTVIPELYKNPDSAEFKALSDNPWEPKVYVEGSTLSPYQVESNQLATTFAETGGDFEQTVGFPYYWSIGEEQALKSIIAGESIENIDYYKNVTPNGRKFPQIPIEQVVNARIEATKDLRKKDNEKPLVFNSGENISAQDYKDLCVYPSKSKPAQKLCSNPEITNWMLENSVEHYQGQESDINTIRNGNNYKESLVDERPLSTLSLSEIIRGTPLPDRNQRYGKYGLTIKRIDEQVRKQGIDPNLPFSEELQDQIMLGLIFEMANKGKEFSTLTSDYRRIKWLKPETIQGFNAIIESKNPELQTYFKSPYNQIHVLSTAAANELVDMVGEN